MKILSILLSVYIMLLTGISCADAFESSYTPHGAEIKAASGVHTECPGDSCSPLCTCCCCAGFTKPAVMGISNRISLTAVHNSPYKQRMYYSVLPSLFQPPRI